MAGTTDTTPPPPRRPAPVPAPADPFQRQRELLGWDQGRVAAQRVLVLGVGGVGTHVAAALCRMGVARVTVLDNDFVETHNLNRQMLFCRDHVRESKAGVAADVLLAQHCPGDDHAEREQEQEHVLRVEAEDSDAIERWDTVVTLLRESTCCINTIDHGDLFDAAVAAACRDLGIPMLLGGTEPFVGHTISTFAQTGNPADVCYGCAHGMMGRLRGLPDAAHWISVLTEPGRILETPTLRGLPKDEQPDRGGSTHYSAGTAGLLLAAQASAEFHRAEPSFARPIHHQVIFNLISLSCDRWTLPPDPECWMRRH